jgi:hypothetical protein
MNDPHRVAARSGPTVEAPVEGTSKKRPYHSPALTVFGDLRDLTMGVSAGVGESGNPAVFRA